jgi:hypothetical protein
MKICKFEINILGSENFQEKHFSIEVFHAFSPQFLVLAIVSKCFFSFLFILEKRK